jgi:trimethylamine--corrinoid protein Co-methyltransferase
MHLQLKAVSEDDLSMIHEASLKLLKETGCVFHREEALEIFKKHGAKIDGKTVFFPKAMIENAMKTVPRSFRWRARNDDFSTTIGEEGFRLAPNAGCIFVQDIDSGRRLARLDDVRKIQTIHQHSDVTDFVGHNPCDPGDIDPRKKHLYITYETLNHTNKPLISYFGPSKGQSYETLQMMKIAFGEKDVLENHHVLGLSIPPTSPLSYPEGGLRAITAFARHNQPVMIGVAMMGGITGPLNLMGIALQQNAELLAGTTYVQLIRPGCPVVWCASSTVAWLKTANYNTGTPEGMLPNIAGFQMAKDFYHVPTRSMAGLTDSKVVDCQAGYETMQNLMIAMLGGAHIIYEALGVLDGITTTSYEKIIIDEELYSRARRIFQGVDTSSEQLSLDTIQEVGCEGEFLSHESTLNNFRDMWQPTVSNWDTHDEWQQGGSEEVVMKANKIWKERLKTAPETFLEPDVNKDLKAYVESHKQE